MSVGDEAQRERRLARWHGVLALAAILATTALAYAPALRGDFVFDDFVVLRDPALRDPMAVVGAIPRSALGGGRALTDLTFSLGLGQEGAADPFALHLASLAVHLAAVLALFFVAREIFRRAGVDRPTIVLGATALFALHPLASEAVAYIAQRSESLASLLAAIAIWA